MEQPEAASPCPLGAEPDPHLQPSLNRSTAKLWEFYGWGQRPVRAAHMDSPRQHTTGSRQNSGFHFYLFFCLLDHQLSLKPLGFPLHPPDSSTQSPNLFKHVKRGKKKLKKIPSKIPQDGTKTFSVRGWQRIRGWELWLSGASPERRPTKGKKNGLKNI